MKATITDVAKLAGVSMKTVSRVLNNEPNVAEKTRERVKAVAAELRYAPNLAARGLASSKSYLIALIYDNPSPNYIARLQRGAIDACRSQGYHLVIEPISMTFGQGDEAIKENVETILSRLPVDGVILSPPLCDSAIVLQTLDEMNIEYVLVAPEETQSAVPQVAMDDVKAAFELTEFLIKQGHEKIGFVKGHADHGASSKRLKGYKQAIQASSLQIDESLIREGDFSFRSGVIAAESLLGRKDDRPTAIFASNDDMAAGVMSVAARLGLRVPDQLSVCGFDDTPLAKIVWPQMTTVQQPIYQMGYQAADMLVQSAGSGMVPTAHTLNFEIMVRDSTGVCIT